MKCTDRTCWNCSSETSRDNSESCSQPCPCGDHLTCQQFLNQIISSPDRREITWRDAETYGDSSWVSSEEMCETIRKAPPVMRTLGYVLYENDTYIAMADTIGPEETSAITKIPIQMIISMQSYTSVEDYYESDD